MKERTHAPLLGRDTFADLLSRAVVALALAAFGCEGGADGPTDVEG